MKKAIAIIILGLLWCEVSFALSQQSAINQYLSGRKLDLIEGVWADTQGNINLYAKSGNGYQVIRIRHNFDASGSYGGSLNKGSENYYYGNSYLYYPRRVNCRLTITVSITSGQFNCDDGSYNIGLSLTRLWPSDIRAHNAKFEKKKRTSKGKR